MPAEETIVPVGTEFVHNVRLRVVVETPPNVNGWQDYRWRLVCYDDTEVAWQETMAPAELISRWHKQAIDKGEAKP